MRQPTKQDPFGALLLVKASSIEQVLCSRHVLVIITAKTPRNPYIYLLLEGPRSRHCTRNHIHKSSHNSAVGALLRSIAMKAKMFWRRKYQGELSESCSYYRLLSSKDELIMEERMPKGYVPMLIGREEGEVERFLVHVRLLKVPCFLALLELAAEELGYRNHGIIRIPCNAQQFRNMVSVISKSR